VISAATKTLNSGWNQNQIGLNGLLQEYLGSQTQNTNKDAIIQLMKQDENFWHTQRPLTREMLQYAAQDALFLPSVYDKMKEYFTIPYIDRTSSPSGEPVFTSVTVLEKILADTKKCREYARINTDVKDFREMQIGREIVAFIKNYRRDVIYCSLNLGVSGVIRDLDSRKTLEKYNSFGDLVYVTHIGFEGPKNICQLTFSR